MKGTRSSRTCFPLRMIDSLLLKQFRYSRRTLKKYITEGASITSHVYVIVEHHGDIILEYG